MSTDKKSIQVKALKFHTYDGKERQEGDVYAVKTDETQTADQYADTLTALKFAVRCEDAKDADAKTTEKDGHPVEAMRYETDDEPVKAESKAEPKAATTKKK